MSDERIEAALRAGPPDDPRYEPILGGLEPPGSATPTPLRVRPGAVRGLAGRRRTSGLAVRRGSQLAAGLAAVAIGSVLAAAVLVNGKVGGPSATPQAGGAARTIPGQELLQVVTRWSARHGSGIAVGVLVDGKLHTSSALGHVSTAVGRLGAVSRLPLVAVVLQLVDAQAIALDGTLRDHGIDWPDGDRITVRMLLSGSSGVAAFGQPLEPLVARLAAEPDRAWSPADALAIARTGSPRFPPGTRFELVDTDDALLAAIVESVTGRPAGLEIRERVLAPLEMSRTFLFDEPVPPPGTAQDPARNPGVVELWRAIASGTKPGSFAYVDDVDARLLAVLGPARGTAATGVEMARLAAALHGGGLGIVPPGQFAAFNRAFEDGGFGGRWGCPCEGSTGRALVIEGTVGLYTAYVAWIPADGTTIGMIANRGLPADALAELVDSTHALIRD